MSESNIPHHHTGDQTFSLLLCETKVYKLCITDQIHAMCFDWTGNFLVGTRQQSFWIGSHQRRMYNSQIGCVLGVLKRNNNVFVLALLYFVHRTLLSHCQYVYPHKTFRKFRRSKNNLTMP